MHTFNTNPEVSIKLLLEDRVTKKSGKHPVKIRVTYQRIQKYYTVRGHDYTSEEYGQIMDEKNRGEKKNIRLKLTAIETWANNLAAEMGDNFSFEEFVERFKNKKVKAKSLTDYFDSKIDELNDKDKIKTAVSYGTTIKSLQRFDPKINFQRITPQFLKKYEMWMIDNGKSYTTICIYLRNLRHILTRAMEDKVIKENPFGKQKGKYSIPHAKTKKRALSQTEILKLLKYKPNDDNEALAFAYFKFSYLCNGMNMADIANLKFKNIEGDHMTFIRQKTKDMSHELPVITVLLHDEARKIIDNYGNKVKDADNYIFPIYRPELSALEKYKILGQRIKLTNKYLRRIAEKIGINEKITTYFARHTYGTMLKRSGVPIEFIGEQFGHKSTKTTRNYLDSFEDEQRKKYAEMLIPRDEDEQSVEG